MDVRRNSKSQACDVPGRNRGGRAVAGRRTAGAMDFRALPMTSAPLSFVLFGKALRMGLLRGRTGAGGRSSSTPLNSLLSWSHCLPIPSARCGASGERDPSKRLTAGWWSILGRRGSCWRPRRTSVVTSGRRLRAFFGCLYCAAMRPGEALGLRRSDCTLPAKGWGRIELTETRPTGGVLGTSSYWRVWQEARPIALPPDKTDSPLAHRPYEFRHRTWLLARVTRSTCCSRSTRSASTAKSRR